MSSDIKAQVRGLDFSNNVLSAAQPGSLAVANDVSVNAAGLLEPRRGFTRYPTTFGTSSQTVTSVGIVTAGHYLAHYGSTVLAYDGTAYSGTFSAVLATRARMRFVRAASNVYLNTLTGTKVLNDTAVAPAEAGGPKAIVCVGAYPVYTSGGTWFEYNTAVAYRYTISSEDPNGNLHQGAPSGRAVVRNRILVPAGSMVRVGNVVTVTMVAGTYNGLGVGDIFTLTPGEASFAAGSYTVTVVVDQTTFKFASVAANATSSLDQDCSIDRATNFQVSLPSGVTTSHVVEVFRSEATLDSSDEPSDELFKCYERRLTATDVSNLGFSIFDLCPESLLGDPLYTNPSEEGLAQANERPPIGLDLGYFADRMWLANTVSRHRFELTLLGTSSPDGLQNNWTITVADVSLTAKTSPTLTTHFQLYSSLPTPALNVEATARALVDAVNANSTLVWAFYISGPDDSPGRMAFEERAIGGSAFHVYGATSAPAVAACWVPALPIASGSTGVSDNNTQTNGVAYSKLGMPEAWPLLNTLSVGPAGTNIYRRVGIRETQFVFTDAGIYTITGSDEPFRVQKLAEAVIIAADTVVLLGEAVWALTDQGVVRITETGVSVVSRPIESALTALFGVSSTGVLSNLQRRAFAIGHESARQLILYLPSTRDIAYCDQAYVYNIATQAWTRWTRGATCGITDPFNDRVVLGASDTNKLLLQANSRDSSDYADNNGVTVTLSGASGRTLTVASTDGVYVGDRLFGTTSWANVSSVDSATQLTVDATIDWTLGSVVVYSAFACEAYFNPSTGGDPAMGKSFGDVDLLFQQSAMTNAYADFSSDTNPAVETMALSFTTYGHGGYGTSPYGDPHAVLRRVFPVPNGSCAQLTVGFRVREAGSFWQLAGYTASFATAGGKNHR